MASFNIDDYIFPCKTIDDFCLIQMSICNFPLDKCKALEFVNLFSDQNYTTNDIDLVRDKIKTFSNMYPLNFFQKLNDYQMFITKQKNECEFELDNILDKTINCLSCGMCFCIYYCR